MAENCKIYTPESWVEILLDEIGYKTNLYGKRVLENSCGTGNILCGIVERYILDAKNQGYTKDTIIQGLENDITGVEIESESVKICLERLNCIAKKYGLMKIRWHILQQDALEYYEKDYMYIIGNPPYITYHDLSVEEREKLRTKFTTCRKGRFDYCYAFIEQSINSLKYRGKLAYILPNSILKNVWAEELRAYVQPYLRKIIDLKNENVFDDVTLSPIILVAQKEKRKPAPKVKYQCIEENRLWSFDSTQVNSESWALGGYVLKSKHRFGDYYGVANSIATLLNDAFLIKEYKIVDETYIEVQGNLIERAILSPAISIKTCKADQQPLIIFPYRFNNQKILHFSEAELMEQFPGVVKHLMKYRKRLDKRTSDKSAQWFEYGRSQAISHLNCEKIIISAIVSGKIKVEMATAGEIPYAGLYITQKKQLSLDVAKEILEHEDFKKYIRQYGVPTTKDSYRISKKIVEEYFFEL